MQQHSFDLASEEERCFSAANNSLICARSKLTSAWRRGGGACCARGVEAPSAARPRRQPPAMNSTKSDPLANSLGMVSMNARFGEESQLPNRHVTDGTSRARRPAYLYVMTLKREPIRQPVVGTASRLWNARLRDIASMRQGRSTPRGGSAPRELSPVTVTNGIAMAPQGMVGQGMKSSPSLPETKGGSAETVLAAQPGFAIDRRSAADARRADDIIVIEPGKEGIDLHLGDADPTDRRQNYPVHKTEFGSGALWPYAPFVRPAVTAAAAHPGASEEIHVYADI